MSELTVVRLSGQRDRLRAYKVVVDGRTVGEVAENSSAHFAVSEGVHLLQVKVDWAKSPPIAFDLGAERLVVFCRPNGDGYLDSILKRNNYIELSLSERSEAITTTNRAHRVSRWTLAIVGSFILSFVLIVVLATFGVPASVVGVLVTLGIVGWTFLTIHTDAVVARGYLHKRSAGKHDDNDA